MKNKLFAFVLFVLFILVTSLNSIHAQEKKVKTEPKKTTGVATTITEGAFVPGVAWTISEGKSTRLLMKKIIQDESISKETEFEVEKDQQRFKVSIKGFCADGEIHVNIIRPSGKTYKTLILDSSAEIEWSQSVRFTEEDDDFVGKWIVQIVAEKADGLYEVVLTAN
jgi:hypothetical protein